MSTFVIVPGAWDTPATMEPLVEPLETAGHAVIVVDLPCDDAAATLEHYTDAMRAALPDDLANVVLVGYSFGGFTRREARRGAPQAAGNLRRGLDPAAGCIGARPLRRQRSVRRR